MKYSFGKLLLLVRGSTGMSQDEFAGKLDVSKSLISRYESGGRTLTRDKFQLICHRLGLSSKLTELLIADSVSPKNQEMARELGLLLLNQFTNNLRDEANLPQ